MKDQQIHSLPADIEQLLDEVPADFWRELEDVLPAGLVTAPLQPDPVYAPFFEPPENIPAQSPVENVQAMPVEEEREDGFWKLKNEVTGNLPDIPPIAVEKVPVVEPERVIPEPVMPENNIDFDISFRGYNRRQVERYIDALTIDYNKICARCQELEKQNEFLREGTDVVGSAILKAEKLARQIIAEAEGEAGRIRRGAAPRAPLTYPL